MTWAIGVLMLVGRAAREADPSRCPGQAQRSGALIPEIPQVWDAFGCTGRARSGDRCDGKASQRAPIGDRPPAETDAGYLAHRTQSARMPARTPTSLREARGGSDCCYSIEQTEGKKLVTNGQ